MCEIEFYLNTKEHQDTFTHGDQMQHENAKWYFHKVGGTYKSGSYKGLDLSFGKHSAIGGILIRALMRVKVAEEG